TSVGAWLVPQSRRVRVTSGFVCAEAARLTSTLAQTPIASRLRFRCIWFPPEIATKTPDKTGGCCPDDEAWSTLRHATERHEHRREFLHKGIRAKRICRFARSFVRPALK